ncbi:MAG: YicC/YloC family endoribonuclease [Xanthomonadales bacterium]|nr:YicC/YloC family endoribonuclease [Xanthomonadales bacterium]
MTAFAALRRPIGDGLWLEGEGRCLNHRQLDLQLRLPEALRWLEPRLRARLAGAFARGRVEIALRLGREAEGEPPLSLDRGLVRRLAALVAELREAVPGLAAGSAGRAHRLARAGARGRAGPRAPRGRGRGAARRAGRRAQGRAGAGGERAREGDPRAAGAARGGGGARAARGCLELAAAARERLAARLAELRA